MVQYNYNGVLTNDVASQVFGNLQECPYVIEVSDSPAHEWFKANLKQQDMWRETDNWSGGVDRYAYQDVRYLIVHKEWSNRDSAGNIRGDRFIFVNNCEDFKVLHEWAVRYNVLVNKHPFWSSF